MKITQPQIKALAESIANKIRTQKEKRKKEITKELSNKISISRSEQKQLETFCKIGKDLELDEIIISYSSWDRLDIKELSKRFLIEKIQVEKDKLEEAEGLRTYPTTQDIVSLLIIASIDAKDLNDLTNSLASQLGIKLDDIK